MTDNNGSRTLAGRFAAVPLLAVAVFFLDQAAKLLVRQALAGGRVVDLIDGLLRLDYTRNSGAAFGVFPAGGAVFALAAVAVTAAIALAYRRVASSSLAVRVSLGFIAGGAVGNLADRLRLGYVVDFIDLRWWYVFNLADSAIVIGVLILLSQGAFRPVRSAG